MCNKTNIFFYIANSSFHTQGSTFPVFLPWFQHLSYTPEKEKQINSPLPVSQLMQAPQFTLHSQYHHFIMWFNWASLMYLNFSVYLHLYIYIHTHTCKGRPENWLNKQELLFLSFGWWCLEITKIYAIFF